MEGLIISNLIFLFFIEVILKTRCFSVSYLRQAETFLVFFEIFVKKKQINDEMWILDFGLTKNVFLNLISDFLL